MPPIALTPEQRRAVEAIGTSVIVTAAAGSGKTAVLAERCAHLVCDAPPDARCDVDQLLVLTFTEAAAAEMRTRIVDAIRRRSRRRPRDARLREQLALADTARISTIHAFCLWLIRRWFSDLGVDPSAGVLDADEARLLRRRVLDDVFSRLFAAAGSGADALGVEQALGDGRYEQDEEGSLPARFVRLVEVYGLGDDAPIAEFVLSLSDFVASVPGPEAWLTAAADSCDRGAAEIADRLYEALRDELGAQVEHCIRIADRFDAGPAAGRFHAGLIRSHADLLRRWRDGAASEVNGESVDARRARFDAIHEEIRQHAFDRRTGPRIGKDAEAAARAAREHAGEQWSTIKKLFKQRLVSRFALFSAEEWIAGLASTAPFARTIVELVGAFGEAYTQRKRVMGVLDFSDLERMAFDLLRARDGSAPCSAIAQALHRKFAHVLVDEFQDVNPIQEAILRLASRECDPERPGNLFVVGDVKQSIYRFRLAEPAVFTDRLRRSRSEVDSGSAITLARNFRSRVEILDFVNHVFRQLMRVESGVAYDAEAELRPGRADARTAIRDARPARVVGDETDPTHKGDALDAESAHDAHDAPAIMYPIELHVVPRSVHTGATGDVDSEGTDDDHDDGAFDALSPYGRSELDDPARWSPIEREAYVIGERIRGWMATAESIVDGRPLGYRDVVVLLRAAKVNAERIAAVLSAMEIPAHADVGGSLFGALEIRDVLALLEVLDNFRQDIPLAGVLRSGIIAEPLSDDDLVEIRCFDRTIAFHEAFRRYAAEGSIEALRERAEMILRRIDAYRADARRAPIAEFLWDIYHRGGHLAYVGGLPNGVQRQANLRKLHELARQFGTYRRQGLHRFLAFVRAMAKTGQDVATAPAIGESEDVVRVMSIHQAKGLEFPVVFIAGLGTRFHLGDRKGRMIFDRGVGIGLRAVDTDRMIEYPSAAHRLAEMEIERAERAEELRILYVAMTRARERLILVGSHDNAATLSPTKIGGAAPPTRLEIETASCPLDWLLAVIGIESGDRASAIGVSATPRRDGPGAHGEPAPPVRFVPYSQASMASWRTSSETRHCDRAVRSAVARCDPLPSDEPLALDDPEVERVLTRLENVHPRLAMASIRATVAAGEVGADHARGAAMTRDRAKNVDSERAFRRSPSRYAATDRSEAAQRGVLMHRVLQYLDFAVAVDGAGVALELHRMVEGGVVSLDDRGAIDADALVWFVATPLADSIRQAGDAYRREFTFVARESPEYFDANVQPGEEDFVLVRGIVDGILPSASGIDIVDYKTDDVSEDEAASDDRHRAQMSLYARAMARTWRRPVGRCLLVYLSARTIVTIDPVVVRG